MESKLIRNREGKNIYITVYCTNFTDRFLIGAMKVLLYYLKQLLKFNLPFSFIMGSFAIALVPENWMKGFLTGALFSFFTGGFLLSVFFYHLRFVF